MGKRTKPIVTFLVASAAVALAAPAVADEGDPSEGTTFTSCRGGSGDDSGLNVSEFGSFATDRYTLIAEADDLRAHDVYMSLKDFSLWEDTNDRPGVQRTARMCTVTNDQGKILDTFAEYEADERLTPWG